MALVYDNTRTAKQGGGYIERDDPMAFARVELPQLRQQAADRRVRSQGRWNTVNKLAYAGVAAPLAFAAAPTLTGMFGGGAATAGGSSAAAGLPAAATQGIGFDVAAPALSTASRIGSMFNSRGAELGVNTALSLLGGHSQAKAANQARADTLAANKEAIALQRQQLESQIRNADLDREDARAANAALNELKKRELDAAEEERAYKRQLDDEDRAYLAPYRQISQQAASRLAGMWNLG